MRPEISEFSYGFALTNELVGWAPLTAAPIFPSLIEEGKPGGGYDVKFDHPGCPLYLQFKRAECMVRDNAREVKDYTTSLTTPYYRFKLMEKNKSLQHDLLLDLDDGVNMVFYAAPKFHELDEINDAWNNNQVATRSIFVKPSNIGPLDDEVHFVAYNQTHAYRCSEAQPIKFHDGMGVVEVLKEALKKEKRPLSETLPEIRKKLQVIRDGQEEPGLPEVEVREAVRLASVSEVPQQRPVPVRSPEPLSGSQAELRNLADMASMIFDTQLIIVQENS